MQLSDCARKVQTQAAARFQQAIAALIQLEDTLLVFDLDASATITHIYDRLRRILTIQVKGYVCLLYTSDAADERSSVDLGGRRIIKKNNKMNTH